LLLMSSSLNLRACVRCGGKDCHVAIQTIASMHSSLRTQHVWVLMTGTHKRVHAGMSVKMLRGRGLVLAAVRCCGINKALQECCTRLRGRGSLRQQQQVACQCHVVVEQSRTTHHGTPPHQYCSACCQHSYSAPVPITQTCSSRHART
jgi:hypothetical protein